ncbi:MAG: DUF3149 domain-containing protein [Burkholderiaceae bacterium]
MVALRELFFTDAGLMSLIVILFICGMAVWFGRFFAKKMAESQPPADTPPVQPLN